VTDERVALDALIGVVELKLPGGEHRWLIDGDPAFDLPTEGVVRIGIGTKQKLRGPLMAGLYSDSAVDLRIPELDLDSDVVHDLRLEFFTGDNPLVLINGAGTMARSTLDFVVRRAITAVGKKDWRAGRFIRVADGVEYMGLWALRRRTSEVEKSVRQALSDEDFSTTELQILQAYPEQLAKVERAAASLKAKWPEVRSAEPNSDRFVPRVRVTPNPFGELVSEAGRDAKDAIGRLSGLISSQQIVLTQKQARETSRFQRVVTIVGATVLVPGLVAAVFGANVGFHGRGTTSAFWAMLLLMAGGGVATYALVRSFEAGVWRGLSETRAARWAGDLSVRARTATSERSVRSSWPSGSWSF
jgi:hypothetical protein